MAKIVHDTDSPRRGRKSRQWIMLAFLLAALAGLVAIAPSLERFGQQVARVPGHVVEGAVQVLIAGGQMVMRGVEKSFTEIDADDIVKARLGEPLVFPALETIAWPERTPETPPDMIEFRYTISGPRGAAKVTGALRTTATELLLDRLTVEPEDGSAAIVVHERTE